MSKKNSSVNLKNGFQGNKELSNIFLNFKYKLNSLQKKKYVVAVSGGPDSLALAALTKAYTFCKKTKFYYVLVDHNIRKNSGQEAKRVQNFLKKKNLKLRIFLNKKKIIKNIQAEARNARYDILKNFCIKNNVKVILTGHNLEDQVETFLMRLSRGSGLRGLSAMKPLTKINGRVSLFRPLLDTQKQFLVKISKTIFGTYLKDPSNKNEKYLRTKIRNLKGPLKKSGIEYEQIVKSINNLASSKATLEAYFSKIFKEIIKTSKKEIIINLKKFKVLNNEAKISVINESIKKLMKNYYNPRYKKVETLINNIENTNFKKSTLAGCLFVKRDDKLCLKVEKN